MAKTLKKCAEFDCSKDVSKGATCACIYCQSLTHKNCNASPITDVSKFTCATCLIKDVKEIQSGELVEEENILKLSFLEDNSDKLDDRVPLLCPCTLCKKIFRSDADLSNHLSQCHDFTCTECREKFTIENEKSC